MSDVCLFIAQNLGTLLSPTLQPPPLQSLIIQPPNPLKADQGLPGLPPASPCPGHTQALPSLPLTWTLLKGQPASAKCK